MAKQRDLPTLTTTLAFTRERGHGDVDDYRVTNTYRGPRTYSRTSRARLLAFLSVPCMRRLFGRVLCPKGKTAVVEVTLRVLEITDE